MRQHHDTAKLQVLEGEELLYNLNQFSHASSSHFGQPRGVDWPMPPYRYMEAYSNAFQ